MVMDASRINDLWEKKYQHQDHGGLAYNISTDWTPVSGAIEGRFFTKERIEGIVGPPRISFILNNPSQLQIKMTMSDIVIVTQNYYKGELDEELIETKNVNATITCFNDITKITGTVDSSMHTVAVDMSSSLLNLNLVGITAKENLLLGAAIEELFRKLSSQSYDLGTIDYNSARTPISLKPRQFLFTTGGTGSSGKLLMCILTGATRTNRVTEPTVCEIGLISKDTGPVIPSGYTAALYISSELIFEDIMLPEFRSEISSGATATMISLPPLANDPAYELSSGSIDFTCAIYVGSGCKSVSRVLSIPGNFKLSGSIDGRLHLYKPNSRWTTNVEYVGGIKTMDGTRCFSSYDKRWFEVTLNVYNSATTDSDGKITFPSFSTGINTVKYQYEDPSGWSNLWGPSMRKFDKSSLLAGKCIENEVKNLGFSFRPVSVFVLTNLIFPEAKVMDVKKALFPGDLLVLGDVVKDYNPTL